MKKTAVILAGGLGTRLKPFTNIIPKPLLPIGEKSVLEIQLNQLKKFGFKDVYLATNYKSDYIESFFNNMHGLDINLYVSREEQPLGTAGPIKLLEDRIDEPFLVMNGDVLTLLNFDNFYQFSEQRDEILSLGIKKLITPYRFGNIVFDGHIVKGIEEKPNIISYILAGVYIMKPEIFSYIPKDSYFGMDTLIQALLEQKITINKYDITEYWLDIGEIDSYTEAQEAYIKYFQKNNL